eukprot:5229533-Pleurochrysis_carterae.AAC.3
MKNGHLSLRCIISNERLLRHKGPCSLSHTRRALARRALGGGRLRVRECVPTRARMQVCHITIGEYDAAWASFNQSGSVTEIKKGFSSLEQVRVVSLGRARPCA